jgi:excisionase family DNA binding protein
MMEGNVARSLVSTEIVARWLAITPRHVKRLVGEKRIPFIKVGHFVRFDPAEIEVWIEAHKVAVLSAPAECESDAPIWVLHRAATIPTDTRIAPRAEGRQASVGFDSRRRPVADGPNWQRRDVEYQA